MGGYNKHLVGIVVADYETSLCFGTGEVCECGAILGLVQVEVARNIILKI